MLFVAGFTGFTMPQLITIHIMTLGCFAYMPVQIHQVYVRCSYIICRCCPWIFFIIL